MPAAPAQAPLAPESIQRSIEKARDWLIREQKADGSCECSMRTNETRVGATALVVLALANAGVDKDHTALATSLAWLRRQKTE